MRFDGVILSSIVGVWAVRLRGAARGRGTVAVRSALRSAAEGDAQHGFGRSEMGSEDLPGTCAPHDKHIFVLVSDEPSAWPPKWEESAGLPQALAGALKARKAELGAKLKLTAATALPAAGDASSGDVLVYPDGIRVRGVRAADADALVDLLAGVRSSGAAGLQVEPAHARSAEQPPASGAAAVFVCAHTSRDKRCGVIGPALGEVFAHELAASGRRDVAVRLCSHIGGHKYAGNAIVYGADGGAAAGHWYGYVDPPAAAEIVRAHIVGGRPLITPRLWRGQLGLSEEEQKAKCSACSSSYVQW